jgi:hypothetical protein
MPNTSPSGLNQIERKRLAAAPCKRGELHIRRQLERRKRPSPPIRHCRSRSPALCQRHQDLPDKWVGHVSFPTKRQKRCMFYYAGYIPTLAVEGLSKAARQHSRQAEICCEVNTSGKLTLPRSTPLGSTPPLKDATPEHEITTTIQLQTLICDVGPTCSYPHISTASAGLTHSGERRSTRKVYLARITDLKTVHNQWTQTIAIGLNTLQRLYSCTHPNRTETGCHRFQALPYGRRPSKWIVPSCVSEPGSASAVELILFARGPSKLWNPYPASPGRRLLRRKEPSPDTITRIRLQEGCYPLRVSPRTPPITRRAVCMVRVQRSMVSLTIGP